MEEAIVTLMLDPTLTRDEAPDYPIDTLDEFQHVDVEMPSANTLQCITRRGCGIPGPGHTTVCGTVTPCVGTTRGLCGC